MGILQAFKGDCRLPDIQVRSNAYTTYTLKFRHPTIPLRPRSECTFRSVERVEQPVIHCP